MIKSALLGIEIVAGLCYRRSRSALLPVLLLSWIQLLLCSGVQISNLQLSAYGYPYGYSSYNPWPYSYPGPAYRSAPAYSDPYAAARPYSDSAGPRASGHVGY